MSHSGAFSLFPVLYGLLFRNFPALFLSESAVGVVRLSVFLLRISDSSDCIFPLLSGKRYDRYTHTILCNRGVELLEVFDRRHHYFA